MTPSFRARTIPFGDINPSITGDGAREVTFSWHATHIVLNTSAPRSSIWAGPPTVGAASPLGHNVNDMQKATVIAAVKSLEAGTSDVSVFTRRTLLLFRKAACRSRQPPFIVIRSMLCHDYFLVNRKAR